MTNGTKPVRVVAVTQSDPFFTARFFEAFLEGRSSDRLDLVEIVLLRNFNESKPALVRRDRKSTRLNSSHGYISYAVFCLKKKKKIILNDHKHSFIHSTTAAR